MTGECAFNDALVMVGLNTLTAEQIIINGFNKIKILGDVKEREIDKLVCHISRLRPSSVPLVDACGNIIATFPM